MNTNQQSRLTTSS